MTWINIGALLAVVILTARLAGTGWAPWLLVAPLVAATRLVQQGFSYATPSFIVSVLVLSTWVLTRRADRVAYGLPLGLASALRVWPALLLVPLILKGRRRTAFGTIAAALLATAGGLAILDWRFNDVWGGLVTAAAYWRDNSGNGSLALALDTLGSGDLTVMILGVVTAGLMLLIRRSTPLDQALAFAIVVGVTVSPLSWAHYSLVTLPVFALAWRAHRFRWALVMAAVIIGSQVAGFAVLVGRVALLVAVIVWLRSATRLESPDLPVSQSP